MRATEHHRVMLVEWEYAALEHELGYTFTLRTLLVEALTPGAFATNHPDGPLRHHGGLAFLGDAIIYFVRQNRDNRLASERYRQGLPKLPRPPEQGAEWSTRCERHKRTFSGHLR